MRGKNLLGPWGEEKAAEYLRRKGYTVEAANYRCRLGEIDLIARRRDVVAFVEVKLRADGRFAEAREFVDHRKQERLRKTAVLFFSKAARKGSFHTRMPARKRPVFLHLFCMRREGTPSCRLPTGRRSA